MSRYILLHRWLLQVDVLLSLWRLNKRNLGCGGRKPRAGPSTGRGFPASSFTFSKTAFQSSHAPPGLLLSHPCLSFLSPDMSLPIFWSITLKKPTEGTFGPPIPHNNRCELVLEQMRQSWSREDLPDLRQRPLSSPAR